MRETIRQEKGVTLIALVITVTIIIILTGMLVYNAKESVNINKITNLYNDVETLMGKISTYYAEYGDIPAKVKYENNESLARMNEVIGPNDDQDEFYVIELAAIDGLTLHYGKDYETKIKNNAEVKEQAKYTGTIQDDLYIINKTSHNIFYVKGIEVPQNNGTTKWYYTSLEEIDTTQVAIKYRDGIQIPEGAIYLGGGKETGIRIRKDNTIYQWVVLTSTLNDVPEGITIPDNEREAFLASANANEGYYQQENGNFVIYLEEQEESWSAKYEQKGTYVDINQDEAYLPAGFYVSKSKTMNTIKQGLVVKDEQENQYVWIKVPKEVTRITATSETDYTNIEQDLRNYVASNNQEDNSQDIWYEGCGLTQTEYNNLKNEMLKSIYNNGGFYIGRYEAGISEVKNNGIDSETVDSLIESRGKPLSQANQYPYNYVTCSQAQKLASKIGEGKEYRTSLLFGLQWDLVSKFIETSQSKNKSEMSTLNIYDLAGNVGEYTLEKSKDDNNPCTYVGGQYLNTNTGSQGAMVNRQISASNYVGPLIGFRIAIY